MLGRILKNRYQIQEHLGEGATATVYKALDTRLGRTVALKILLPHVRESARKRFFQEATSVAQLNHPNIMAIYDIDEDKGIHFLVVEYVEGDTLTHYIPAPVDTVISLGRQIAMALDYAHQREIIHRDIKPANIKVTPNGQVKIMDLGLALPREAKRVTADGMIIGTPAYLSPEQAQGLTLDHRTDIYSLGVVLYEMTTGALPFESDDIPALLLQQVKQPPPPPRLHVPDLPMALENVILKALEKNPVRRFQTCGALGAALSAVLRPTDVMDAVLPTTRSTVDEIMTTAQTPRLPLRVVLADDHTILRRALAQFLSERDEFVVVAEASDGDGALVQVLEQKPDELVLDLKMPGKGGLDVLPYIRAQAPSVKVLVLSGRNEDWYIVQALRAGAHGYLLKSAGEQDLVDGILKVMQGALVLGEGVAEKVVGGMLRGGPPTAGTLSEQERQVLIGVAGGLDNNAIAARLKISITTVVETLALAMDKMGAKDRYAAALAALKQGFILLEEVQALEKRV